MKKYVFQADLIRALAIIGVIGVHLVIPITARPDFFGGTLWWITFLANCLFRVSVPLFVILSGYLTLGKPITIPQNFDKVKHRLLIPLLSYYLIFNVAYILMAVLRGDGYDYAGIFHNLSKNTHSSLYFLVVLLFIQLLNPLWNLLTEQKNLPVLKYVCWFFLGLGAVAYVFYYLSLREGEVFSTFTLWMMWVGYYLYGYLVKLQPPTLTRKEVRLYASMLAVGFGATVAFGFATLWLFHNGVSDLFYIGGQTYADAYLSISVIMMSIGAFQLLMRGNWSKEVESMSWLKKPVVFLASLSFALYLNHLLVIDVLNKFFGVAPDSQTMPSLAAYVVINTVLTFLITIPLAVLIQKLPIVRKAVGLR